MDKQAIQLRVITDVQALASPLQNSQLQVLISHRKLKELGRGRMSLEQRLNLVFSLFPLLFDAKFELTAHASVRRPFDLLTECRELFTHPKQLQDFRFSDRFEYGAKIQRTGAAWESFARARRTRDRITHPREPGDTTARPEDVDAAIATVSWRHIEMRDCLTLDPDKVAHRVLQGHDRRLP